MRKAALDEIAKLVDDDPRVVFIGSDLGAGVLEDAMTRHPQRVLMEGIAEQHLVGMASGLALEGFIPYVHTIGTFLVRRALEQIVIDAALHQLPVKLIASGGGMVYAPLGPTHQAIDDFALMRAIPGMAIMAPIDPLESSEAVRLLAKQDGPAYLRLGKGGEPTVTPPGMQFAVPRLLRTGADALVITTGAVGQECLGAADQLELTGVSVAVVHVPTVAPLNTNVLHELIAAHNVVLVVEEHLPSGGLWTALVESLMRDGLQRKLHHASLPNRFAQNYGSQVDHWVASELHAEGLVRRLTLLMDGGTDG